MEEKLTRPQETAPERNQSKIEQHSNKSQSISCGNALRNSITKRSANIRNSNNASNSGLSPVKRIRTFSRHAQSTGSEAVVEKNSTLLTTPTQSLPLTTISVYANLSNVGSIEDETRVTRFHPRAPAPYDALIEDTCKRHTESRPNSTKPLKCRVCTKEFNPGSVQYHLIAFHPEVFFDDIIMSPLSMRQAVHLNTSCLWILDAEINEGKQLITEKEKKRYKKKSEKGIWCKYCNTEIRDMQYFKVHLFRYHHNILKETLKRDLSQSLENQNPHEYGRQGFAQTNKSDSKNKVVGNTRSTWFTTATSTDKMRYGENFHYGNTTARFNDQEAGLGTGPNSHRNGVIPYVASNLSSSSNPNHFSQAGISSITESSNNVNTVNTDQINQYYPTTMGPDNWQYFHPPAPVDEQHRMESNQQVLASDSSQMYSVHPQGSTGIVMDDAPDWEVDLCIATEYLLEENFDFNASINPSST